MLHWLRQKLNKLTYTFTEILCGSLCVHVVFCLFFFGAYKSGPDISFTLQGHRKEAAIIRLLPLGAEKPVACGKQGVKLAGGVKKNTQKKTEKVRKKKTAIVKEKKQKKIKEKKKSKKQKEAAQEIIQEKIPEIEISKNQQEPVPIQEQQTQEEIKPVVTDTLSEANSTQDASIVQEPIPVDDVVYVTQKELELLQLQQQVEDAIRDVWTAPIGIPEDVVCDVIITIGWDGKLVDVSVEQATGIYIYDKAVQDAVTKIALPGPLWGKSIAISFKP